MKTSFDLLKNANNATAVWANVNTKETYPANRNSFGWNALCVRGDASAMVQRLEHIGIRAEITFDGSITLHGVDGSTVSGVWRLAADMGFGVTSLEPMRTSLETLFVDAVREHSHAAG